MAAQVDLLLPHTFAHPPLVVVYGASGTLKGPMVGEDHETETFVVQPLVSGYKP